MNTVVFDSNREVSDPCRFEPIATDENAMVSVGMGREKINYCCIPFLLYSALADRW